MSLDGVMFIGREDLVLDQAEAKAILRMYAGDVPSDESAAELLRVANGQVALLCLLARHPRAVIDGIGVDPVRDMPAGLAKCIQSLVMDLMDYERRRLLLLAVLIGRGCVSDLACADLSVTAVRESVLSLAEALPLLRVEHDRFGREVFIVHDLAYEALASPDSASLVCGDWVRVAEAALGYLSRERRHARLFDIVLRLFGPTELAHWLKRAGSEYLMQGEFLAMRGLIDRLPPSYLLDEPRILVIDATVLKETQHFEAALERATLARRLAVAISDSEVAREALIMQARLLVDLSRHVEAVDVLSQLDLAVLDRQDSCVVHGYYVGCYAQLGQPDMVRSHIACVRGYLEDANIAVDARVFSANCTAFAQAYLLNDAGAAAETIERMVDLPGLPFTTRTTLLGNLGTLCYEMGRLQRAVNILESVVDECRTRALSCLEHTYAGSLAAAYAGGGDRERADGLMARAVDGSLAVGDGCAAWGHRFLRAAWERADGDLDTALRDAEEAQNRLSAHGLVIHASQAQIEALACRVALEDEGAVADEIADLRLKLDQTASSFLLLRADMILAEIERRRDDLDAAVARIGAHAEYILTEGSNWQIAMYIRAFPGLLSVFALALSVDRLPAHMLRMILPDDARRALMFARDVLPVASYERLAERVLGKKRGREFLSETSAPVPLKVKVFGGLSVETPWGPVTDKAWCKRKSRLLFAMMVVSRGKDIARDVLFEHMWNGLPPGRAQSNFYVIWSHMRKALAPGPKAACPYVEHRSGVCRIIPELVTTDLDEFYSASEDMRAARALGDTPGVIAAAERIVLVYQGELLPGDLYDDWFTAMRDALRHEFSDAMLMAANCAGADGNADVAIRFTRAALAQDWWREDLYQAALRYQIMAGQRSGAIETYLTCRSRLSEDLGLDPSMETQKLYEQILAMETRESSGGK
ncbi:MAG: BTAD domain-containing putative transcriptional regulator [Coriobacteriia bacterium]